MGSFLRLAFTWKETCESVWPPTRVSTQIQLVATCDHLHIRLTRPQLFKAGLDNAIHRINNYPVDKC